MNKYYVYAHESPNWSTPFYYGKGCAYRAWDFKRRNHKWRKAAENGVSVRIIKDNMPECCALTLESILIGAWGADWLANISRGGTESSKKPQSDEANEKRRERLLGPRNHNYGMKLSKERLKAMHDALHSKPVSEETRKKRSDKVSGKKHPQLDRKTRIFLHEDGDIFEGLRYDFIKKYNLSAPKICQVISGERKSHKGWRMDRG